MRLCTAPRRQGADHSPSGGTSSEGAGDLGTSGAGVDAMRVFRPFTTARTTEIAARTKSAAGDTLLCTMRVTNRGDPDELPRDSSLRRTYADRVKAGLPLGCGPGVWVYENGTPPAKDKNV